MPKGLNLQSVKSKNRSSVLYLLNFYGRLSRKEIAKKLSLTPAAVTKICADLIDGGYVFEVGEDSTEGKSGRKEIYLALKTEDKYAFCVNAEQGAITYALARIDGKLIKSETADFEDDVEKVIEKSKNFLNGCEEYNSKIIGAGVCIIGDLKDKFGVWKTDNLKEKFASALGIKVTVDNNVKAFAESELMFGGVKNIRSVIFFKWGYGVGSSIVTNGRVFSGNDSGVSEIGHYIVRTDGALCRCGRRGCLETEVSTDAILKELNLKDMSSEELANSQDKEIKSLIADKARTVALALTNAATILNANDVILFGTMFENPETVKALKTECKNLGIGAENMELSSLNGKRTYIGAVAIAAKKFFFEA